MARVILPGPWTIQRDGLVGNDPAGAIGWCRIDAMRIQVGFGAGDEERAGPMEPVQAGKIEIAAVHHVDGTCFGKEHVERMHVVQLAVRYVNETRYEELRQFIAIFVKPSDQDKLKEAYAELKRTNARLKAIL